MEEEGTVQGSEIGAALNDSRAALKVYFLPLQMILLSFYWNLRSLSLLPRPASFYGSILRIESHDGDTFIGPLENLDSINILTNDTTVCNVNFSTVNY